MARLKAFGYFGGKLSHLDFVLEHLPYTERYIEPFGGSAAVLLNKEPSTIETYNDLDGDVVNFFRVLREQPEELVRQLKLTPHSRDEFSMACKEDPEISDVERARRFFVRIMQGYNAKTEGASRGDWSYNIGAARRGMATKCSQLKGYHEQLHAVADRLSEVQIENQDAINLIKTHDHEDALIYCDPPYMPDSRKSGGYAHDMDAEDHRQLARALNQCEAKVAISNYDSDLLRELYPDWTVITGEEKKMMSATRSESNSEVLLTNYDVGDGAKLQTTGTGGSVQNRLGAFIDGDAATFD